MQTLISERTHVCPNSSTVSIQNLTFIYPDGMKALSDVGFELHEGEKVALVGPNGAGKSTLLVHLNGILEKQTGRITICGIDLTRQSVARIRSLVGLVFQSPDDQLFSPTVFDDVAFGPIYQGLSSKEVHQRVDEALRKVQMQDFAHRVSHHLSVGEKKKIAIATVLSMNPEVLVLDEPTAGLDPKARRTIIELLRSLPQTMIVATHDLSMVKELFTRTIIMNHGEIVLDGSSSDLFENQEILHAHGLEMP